MCLFLTLTIAKATQGLSLSLLDFNESKPQQTSNQHKYITKEIKRKEGNE